MSLRGFGTGLKLPALPELKLGDIPGRIVKALEALTAQYVQQPYYEAKPFSLASGGSQAIDSNRNKLQWIVVNVTTGDLLVVASAGIQAGLQPVLLARNAHLRFQVTQEPWVVPLASQSYSFTLTANGALTEGSFVMIGG